MDPEVRRRLVQLLADRLDGEKMSPTMAQIADRVLAALDVIAGPVDKVIRLLPTLEALAAEKTEALR